jgi:hypothetical protein
MLSNDRAKIHPFFREFQLCAKTLFTIHHFIRKIVINPKRSPPSFEYISYANRALPFVLTLAENHRGKKILQPIDRTTVNVVNSRYHF